MDHLNFIMAFEGSRLDREEMIDGFQKMIDDGTVWKLQGSYGRMATRLIENGYCQPATRDMK